MFFCVHLLRRAGFTGEAGLWALGLDCYSLCGPRLSYHVKGKIRIVFEQTTVILPCKREKAEKVQAKNKMVETPFSFFLWLNNLSHVIVISMCVKSYHVRFERIVKWTWNKRIIITWSERFLLIKTIKLWREKKKIKEL